MDWWIHPVITVDIPEHVDHQERVRRNRILNHTQEMFLISLFPICLKIDFPLILLLLNYATNITQQLIILLFTIIYISISHMKGNIIKLKNLVSAIVEFGIKQGKYDSNYYNKYNPIDRINIIIFYVFLQIRHSWSLHARHPQVDSLGYNE